MNPILGLMKVWTILKTVPWLWKLIVHWRDVSYCFEAAWGMVLSARKSGGMPTVNSFDIFLHHVEDCLRKGIIDIPDVNETLVADEIYQMRQLLNQSIADAREVRNLNV